MTGKVSPVSAASLTLKSRASSNMPSAGIRFPAESLTTSPGTISSTATEISLPSRRAAVLRAMRAFSASIAREAPYSCVKDSAQLAKTMTPMMTASLPSPTNIDTTAANMRIRTSGLRNCCAKAAKAVAPPLWPMALRPVSRNRASASVEDRPPACVPKRRRSSSAGTDQKAGPAGAGVCNASGCMDLTPVRPAGCLSMGTAADRKPTNSRQLDMKRLSRLSSSSERVTPPNTHSLSRLCP